MVEKTWSLVDITAQHLQPWVSQGIEEEDNVTAWGSMGVSLVGGDRWLLCRALTSEFEIFLPILKAILGVWLDKAWVTLSASEDSASTVFLLKEALAPERVWAGIRGICCVGRWQGSSDGARLNALVDGLTNGSLNRLRMVRYILNIGHTSLNQFSNYQNFSYINRGSFQARMPFVSLIRNYNRTKKWTNDKVTRGSYIYSEGIWIREHALNYYKCVRWNDNDWVRGCALGYSDGYDFFFFFMGVIDDNSSSFIQWRSSLTVVADWRRLGWYSNLFYCWLLVLRVPWLFSSP